MENSLQIELASHLSLERLLKNPALAGKITVGGQLEIETLWTYLNDKKILGERQITTQEIVAALQSTVNFSVSSDHLVVSNALWADFPFELKIKNCGFENLLELEEDIVNSKFRKDILDQEFLACEAAILIRLQINDHVREHAANIKTFILSSKTFCFKEVEILSTSLKLYILRKQTNISKLTENTSNVLAHDKRVRLSSFSEDETLRKPKIVRHFLEIKEFIGINKNLENLDLNYFPIIDKEGNFELEELTKDKQEKSTTNGGHESPHRALFHQPPNYRKNSFRKSSFNMPARKTSFNN